PCACAPLSLVVPRPANSLARCQSLDDQGTAAGDAVVIHRAAALAGESAPDRSVGGALLRHLAVTTVGWGDGPAHADLTIAARVETGGAQGAGSAPFGIVHALAVAGWPAVDLRPQPDGPIGARNLATAETVAAVGDQGQTLVETLLGGWCFGQCVATLGGVRVVGAAVGFRLQAVAAPIPMTVVVARSRVA